MNATTTNTNTTILNTETRVVRNTSSARSNRAPKWEKREEGMYGAIVECQRQRWDGSLFASKVAFRLWKRTDGGYDVDVNSGIGPWEAIDDGKPARTLKEGKAIVREWLTLPR